MADPDSKDLSTGPVGRRLGVGAATQFAGIAIQQVLKFGTHWLVARLLGASVLGLFNYSLTFWSAVEMSFTGGLIRMVMRYPLTMIGSDAVATSPETGGTTHPRCYGTYPRVLGRYVRDEKVLTWEEAIYKMTGLPAKRLGLTRRGRIQPGFAADLVIFNPATVIDRATFEQPHAYPEGIEHVLVNGVFAVRDGRLTGALAGRVLRHGTCEFGPAGV